MEQSYKKQKHFCDVCHKVAASGVLPDKSRGDMKQKVPIPMLIIGGLGAVMMFLGMIFTLTGPKDPEGEMSIVNILFGAFTTAAGFMLVRRTINNRKLLLGNV